MIHMKKLLVLSVLLSSFLFSCKKDQAPTQEQITKSQLVGKWDLTQKGEVNPIGSAEVITPASGTTYEFLENGNFILAISGVGTTYSWTAVDASTIKYSPLDQSFENLLTIVQVDATNLKLSTTFSKNGVPGIRYLYFTKIP
jgi:hypothetical protein